jgi:hypothetical protein
MNIPVFECNKRIQVYFGVKNTNTDLKDEEVSKIFRTGAAIYTAVVVTRSTGRW